MNATFADSMAQALALTLFHFLWQGVAVWAAVACLMHVVDPRRAQTRYAIYCATLALLAACPVIIWAAIGSRPVELAIAEVWQVGATIDRDVPLDVEPAGDTKIVEAARSLFPATAALQSWIDRYRLAIALAWLGGVAWFGARLGVGAVRIWRIAAAGQPLPAEWSDCALRIARRMGFRAVPALRVVEWTGQAMAVGLVKPMVLLPAAWISQLHGDVLEAVIAHELAHLRRWDLLVNFAQRLVEAAFFFHPVVWWCSRRIRIEREMCCDELAVESLGNPAGYAKVLTYLAHQGTSALQPIWGVGIGGPQMVLLHRIRNVLGMTSWGHSRLYGPACAVAGAAAASLVWTAVAYRAPQGASEVAGQADNVPELLENQFPIPEPPAAGAETGEVVPAIRVPTEHTKTLLPHYTIEPPDILFIEALRVMPKAPYHIQGGDELQIVAEPAEANLASRGFIVDTEGRVDLGPRFGKVQVAGLTTDEASEAVRKAVLAAIPNPVVSLTVLQSSPLQAITGEHLVSPDGSVSLGIYGQVHVAGLTLKEAKTAIEMHLAEFLDNPLISVSVFAYNSKVYYVIVEDADKGDTVTRVVSTGSETVLDALSHITGLRGLSKKRIWIARPQPGGAKHDMVLTVDWSAITKGASTATNYQVLPGDRIFVVGQSGSKPLR